MSKDCKEKRAERTSVRSNALTRQAAAQQRKATMVHAGHRPFSPLLRCKPLKAFRLPAVMRLTGSKNSAAHRGKINRS